MSRTFASRLRRTLLVAAAAALALTTTSALAGSGVGGVFNLGQTNTVDAQTVLSGNAGSSAELRINNTGTGPALSLIVPAGVTPLKVTSTTKVDSFNADLLDGFDSTGFWRTNGNTGTNPGANFIGTTDNKAFELKVNGKRALRVEPTVDVPNIVGGGSTNAVTAGVRGAVIAGGGGGAGVANVVTDDFGTVGGGGANKAGDAAGSTSDRDFATVGGGNVNSAQAELSTIGGGSTNTVDPGAIFGTIGGGDGNAVRADTATISGGATNLATGAEGSVVGGLSNTAAGPGATVAGGTFNHAGGSDAFVAGGNVNSAEGAESFAGGDQAKALHDGVFVWADRSDLGDFSSTAPNQFDVRASGGAKIVRGEGAFSTVSQAALQVEQNDSGDAVGWFRMVDPSNTHAVVSVIKQSTGTGNFLQCFDQTDATHFTSKCHIDKNGTWVSGSDFAESLPARGDHARYQPRDVLSMSVAHPGEVMKSTRARDRALIGVYSTRPGVLGADKGGITRVGRDDVPVAITGIVPVKVTARNGAIRPGDLLTSSSIPGRAMNAGANPRIGTVLGKALGALPRGNGVIRMLVMLR